MVDNADYRIFFEKLLDEIRNKKFKITRDEDINQGRIVVFEKYQIICTIIKTQHGIDFDIYADLKSGIYELGELHVITRKMLELKKIALKYNGREMNTTERLYPSNRQGNNTRTSGL